MMHNKATTTLALMMLSMLPMAAMAAVQCSVQAGPGNAEITVTVTVDVQDPDIDATNRPTEDNATTSADTCDRANLPYSSCVFTAIQTVPGPSSVTAHFSQDGGRSFQDCGPFDNEDGLPVELVELTVD